MVWLTFSPAPGWCKHYSFKNCRQAFANRKRRLGTCSCFNRWLLWPICERQATFKCLWPYFSPVFHLSHLYTWFTRVTFGVCHHISISCFTIESKVWVLVLQVLCFLLESCTLHVPFWWEWSEKLQRFQTLRSCLRVFASPTSLFIYIFIYLFK